MRQMFSSAGLALVAAATAVPATAQDDDAFARMMRGESAMQGKKLEKAIKKAEQHPLGSAENPVRTTMPRGEHLYLSRLRCSDGKAPAFYREGNVGPGVYGNIVDLYIVTCKDAEPGESRIYMDMYHGGFIETRPVPGFTAVVPLEKPEEAREKPVEPRG